MGSNEVCLLLHRADLEGQNRSGVSLSIGHRCSLILRQAQSMPTCVYGV